MIKLFNVEIEIYVDNQVGSPYLCGTDNVVVIAENRREAADQAFCTIHNRQCYSNRNKTAVKEIVWSDNHTTAKVMWEKIKDAMLNYKRYIIYKFKITQIISSDV